MLSDEAWSDIKNVNVSKKQWKSFSKPHPGLVRACANVGSMKVNLDPLLDVKINFFCINYYMQVLISLSKRGTCWTPFIFITVFFCGYMMRQLCCYGTDIVHKGYTREENEVTFFLAYVESLLSGFIEKWWNWCLFLTFTNAVTCRYSLDTRGYSVQIVRKSAARPKLSSQTSCSF